jgi:hypothetical protein
MTHVPHRPLIAGCLLLVAVSGCTESNEGFRTYQESDGDAATVVAQPASPEASRAPDSVPVAPAQEPAPVVVASPVENSAQPDQTTGPDTQPVSVSVTPVEPVAATANSIVPPAPPLAEPIQQISASIPTRKIELLIPEKSFKVVGPEEAVRVSFDDLDLLKVLNADPVPLNIEQHMPPWLLALTGTRVRIRGYMYPPNRETELPGFMMVRDTKDCCFGRNVLIYDKIGVHMREGLTTDYLQLRPFDVVGVMTVKARILDGKLEFLYMINDAIVIEG